MLNHIFFFGFCVSQKNSSFDIASKNVTKNSPTQAKLTKRTKFYIKFDD
jgi:hypothetical protein